MSALIPKGARRVAGALTIILLGIFGVVWVGSNRIGGGILLGLALTRAVLLVRELREDRVTRDLRKRLAQLDSEIDGDPR